MQLNSTLQWPFLLCCFLLTSCSTDSPIGPAPAPERDGDESQREAEALLGGDGEQCLKHLSALTKHTRVAGSPDALAATDYTSEYLSQLGYVITRHAYRVQVPMPKRIEVELIKPLAYSARTHEPPVEVDLDTINTNLPRPFVAYSADGDVQAECVYVGFGRRGDFEHLRSIEITLRGRICIARLSKNHPASIAALAEEYGAAAVLYYTDPHDDGFARGDVYPRGAFRPLESSRRLTALRFFQQQGDPGTPSEASVDGVEQLPYDEMDSLPRIPLATLSASDAQPILESLRGPVVPRSWQGALPITYHVGGTRHCVCHVATAFDRELKTIEVIEARWPTQGADTPFVLVGADRDTLGNGASGSAGATTILLESARMVSSRLNAGALMGRSVRFLSWDGAALGGVGMAEWAQQFEDTLRTGCTAFVDIPHGARGSDLEIRRSFALSTVADELHQLLKAHVSGEHPWRSVAHADLPLGSRAWLLTSLGIPTISLSSTGNCGLADSIYDTLGAVRRHIDPEMTHHADLAGLVTAAVYRLAEPTTPPLHLGQVGWQASRFCDSLEQRNTHLDLSALRETGESIGVIGDRIQQVLWGLSAGELTASARQTINRNLHLAVLPLRARAADGGQPRTSLLEVFPDNADELRIFPELQRGILAGRKDEIQQAAEDLLSVLEQYKTALIHLERSAQLLL